MHVLYCIAERKKQYARRGPTYDEESLRSTDVVPPSSSNTSNTFSAALPAFGRGRGRGRGRTAISTQPLRRPTMPGLAGAGGEKQVGRQPLSSEDESPWSGTFGAGRGRGMRPPNTTPVQGWAGPKSAPDPSVAPLPPTAWQQFQILPTTDSGTASWKEPNMNIAGMPSAAWPALGASQSRPQMGAGSNKVGTNLHSDFQSFSLFDKDEYDY